MPDYHELEAAHLGDPLSAPAYDDEDNTVTIQCHRCQRLITRPAREPHWDGMCACGRSVFEPFQEDEQHLVAAEDQDDVDVEVEPLEVHDLLATADIIIELSQQSARLGAIERRLDRLDEQNQENAPMPENFPTGPRDIAAAMQAGGHRTFKDLADAAVAAGYHDDENIHLGAFIHHITKNKNVPAGATNTSEDRKKSAQDSTSDSIILGAQEDDDA